MKSIKYVLVIFLFPIISFSFSGKGTGTMDDPFQITSIIELQELIKMQPYDKYFILVNDIEAKETRNWHVGDHDRDSTTPDQPKGFIPIFISSCNFDGNGHVIKNLYINLPGFAGVGLFSSSTNSIIKRVGLENFEIIGGYDVGGLCGSSDRDTISECFTEGKITAEKQKNNSSYPYHISGFCGYSNISKFKNCYSNCTVMADSGYDSYSISSFSNGATNVSATYCYTTGKVNFSNNLSCAYCPNERAEGSYWDTDVTGIPEKDLYHGATGLPTAEMMKQKTFVDRGWDFDKIWYIDEGMDYPKLRAFLRDTTDVKDGINAENFSVSPNPTTDFIEIDLTRWAPLAKWSPSVEIRIFNVLGEILTTPSLCDTPPWKGGEKVKIDVSGLVSGLYFVRIWDKVSKFVKI
jgi:hypothetical protein